MASDDSLIVALSGLSGFSAGVRDVLIPHLQARYQSQLDIERERIKREEDLKSQKELMLHEQILRPVPRIKGVPEDEPFDIIGEPGQTLSVQQVKAKPKLGGLGGVDSDVIKNEMSLRKEFNELQEVKEYSTINTKVRQMDRLVKSLKTDPEKSRIGIQQAVITIFNKMTDPQSVTRESEYLRTPEGQALLARVQGGIMKMQKGGAGLTDRDIVTLVSDAKLLANVSGEIFQGKKSFYDKLAEDYGFNKARITGGFSDFSPFQPDDSAVTPARSKIVTLESSPKPGGVLNKDAKGNRAWVYPDGTFDEVK